MSLKTEYKGHTCPKVLTSYATDTCSAMFIAVLVTKGRKWKQPNFSSVSEWIMKMWHISQRNYSSAVKEHEIVEFLGKCLNGSRQAYIE